MNGKRPPLDEQKSLWQGTIAVEGVTTAAGEATGLSLKDAGLVGVGANSFVSMLAVIHPGESSVDSRDIASFNDGNGEVTVATAFKDGQVAAGVAYKIITFRFVPAEVAAIEAKLDHADHGLVAIKAAIDALMGISFTDYHHYADLAVWAFYTPPAQSHAFLCNEFGKLDRDYIYLKFYDGSGWIDAHDDYSEKETTASVFQDTDQNIRVENNGGPISDTLYKISLTGMIWSGGTSYHHYEDLANGATYTPSVHSIATLCNEWCLLDNDGVHVEFYDGSGWLDANAGIDEATCLVQQDSSQNVRVANAGGMAIKIGLTGAIW